MATDSFRTMFVLELEHDDTGELVGVGGSSDSALLDLIRAQNEPAARELLVDVYVEWTETPGNYSSWDGGSPPEYSEHREVERIVLQTPGKVRRELPYESFVAVGSFYRLIVDYGIDPKEYQHDVPEGERDETSRD